MSGPLINVFTYTIKPGKQEEARKRIAELVDFVETNEPRMIAFHAYLDQDGKSLSIVQVHPDSASMEFHMQVNAKHFATARLARGIHERAVLRADLGRAGGRVGEVG